MTTECLIADDAVLLAEIERVKGIRELYKQYGTANGIDLRRTLFDMTEAIERAEMTVERGDPARIMDALRELRNYEP
jgi:hypothetical protein